MYGRQNAFIGAASVYLSYLFPVLLDLFDLQVTPVSRCSPNADKYGKLLTRHPSCLEREGPKRVENPRPESSLGTATISTFKTYKDLRRMSGFAPFPAI